MKTFLKHLLEQAYRRWGKYAPLREHDFFALVAEREFLDFWDTAEQPDAIDIRADYALEEMLMWPPLHCDGCEGGCSDGEVTARE